jgi:glycogen synthase
VHVLITADTVGGVWTYTRELVCGLLDRGHRVTLVSFGRMPTPAQTSWMGRKNLAYYPTSFPLEWMQDSESGIAESAKYLDQIIATAHPDILHFNQFCYGALESGTPKIVVAHSDVLSWWKAVHDGPFPQSRWFAWYRDVVSKGLAGADATIAPSRWMLDILRENYGLSSQRVKAVHNGRNADLFAPSAYKTNCVLSVGRLWDEAKQIKLLLDRTHPVPIIIAGTLQHPDNGESVSLDRSANVTFCGEQDEAQLRVLYSESSIYVATSRYEPFGLAPVEAALSGCALIANDISTFHELWDDAALYFKHNDADGLAETIRLLSENHSLRTEYAHRAFERARRLFTAQRMVSDYEDLYFNLTTKRAAA